MLPNTSAKLCPNCGSDNIWPYNAHEDICMDCLNKWEADNSTKVPIDTEHIERAVYGQVNDSTPDAGEVPEWKEPLPNVHKARTELDTRIEAATFRLDATRCGWPDSMNLRISLRDMAQELWDMRIVDRNQQRTMGTQELVDNLRKLYEYEDIEEPADTIIDTGW